MKKVPRPGLERVRKLSSRLTEMRRHLHAHPETAFNEFETAAYISHTLKKLGAKNIREGIGGTGILCDLGKGNGPIVALRADMDALPLTDEKKVAYASKNLGAMHACGHDAHVAMLLGAAELLLGEQSGKDSPGRVRLIFQPAEEHADANGVSGAPKMIAAGALEGVRAIVALHVDSTRPLGKILMREGRFSAAVDTFSAWIEAKGGHGAYPHQGRDPIWMLIPILAALHGIVARRIDPVEPAVLSVGQIHGGTACNILPSQVFLEGTLRSFSPVVRELLISEVEAALGLARSLGGDVRVSLIRGYPATFNHAGVVGIVKEAALRLLGPDCQSEPVFGMGGEDFAYYCEKVPGAMFMLGAALPDGFSRPHHTPVFDIDEGVLPMGAGLLAESALALLRQSPWPDDLPRSRRGAEKRT